jgi:outer membrane protein insertion porin family
MRFLIFATLACLVLPAPLESQQSSKVSYEGQKVAVVDLVANPKISVDPYRSLVELKANEPYSDRKVENTISSLKQTRRFTDVKVGVKPDPAGLHVTFTLEPALYFGIVDFPGATKHFSYARLLQVVDIPSETTYKQETADAAAGALLKFLIATGYFQAQVRAEPRLDEEHMLANVIFHVTLGKRAKIGNLKVDGPPPAEANRLVHDTRTLRAWATGASLKPGKTYTPKRINAGLKLMKKDLASQHRLASKVEFGHAQYDPETNRADIVVNATPGPVVNIKLAGARLSWIPFLSGRREKRLIPIFSEGAIDPDLVEEGRRNLANFFQGKGYFDVDVTTNFHKQDDNINLLYAIDKGRRHTVQEVAFRGNQHIDEDELEKQVLIKPHHFFFSHGKFSDKLAKKSVNNLETFYKDRGYEHVKVDKDIIDRELKIYVRFLINEGPQTRVDNLSLKGNNQVSGLELQGKEGFQLKPGGAFSPKALASDRSHILAAYLDRGYPNAEFDSQVSRRPDDPTKVDVTYAIQEKQHVHVDQVLLLGQHDTRSSLISKVANLHTEAPLSQKDMLEAESKLYDLGVFDWANVDPRRPITDQDNEDVLIKTHEGKKNSLTYGFGLQIARRGGNLPSGSIALPGLPVVGVGNKNFTFSEKTFVSPRGSIEYKRENIRGLAESLSVSMLVSRLDQLAVASYTVPHFRLSGWKSLFSSSIERTTENPIFEARLGEGSWQLEKPLNKAGTRRLQLRYRFRRTVLSNLVVPGLVLPEDQRLRLSTLSSTWIRDTRDKPLDAHQGFYQTLDFGITPKFLGSSTNFVRFLGQSAYYRPLLNQKNLVWANRVTLGLAKAFSNSHVPTSERFFSGGETTLRGFPINGAGPQRTVPACSNPSDPRTCTNIRVPVGGNQLFILNSEVRFPLGINLFGQQLGGAVFYDGGNVYGPINISQLIRNYTNTVGIGFRYATPVGPVRFDVGRNLNPITGIKATQFFITLGQAF